MRLRLHLEVVSHAKILPVNYKYELSSWIYHVFEKADPAFSLWLHEKGYNFKNKKFKFFTFSDLLVKDFEIKGDRMFLKQSSLSLLVSFMMAPAAEKFITGLFMGQTFTIGDKVSQVGFEVNQIESLQPPEFKPTMSFQMRSPICVTNSRPDRSVEYIVPSHPDYEKRFLDNLVNKFVAYQMHQPVLAGQEVEDLQGETAMKLEIIGTEKSRLLTIKAGTPEQIKLKVFIYSFSLTAPVELIELGYYAGFGEKNSLGLGCVEEKED